jgi:hypothetical protein
VRGPISRREFLGVSAGLVVLAACGDDDTPDVSVDRKKESDQLTIVLGVDPNNAVVAGIEERIPFVVLKGQKPSADYRVEVGFAAGPDGSFGPGTLAEVHKDGIEERPYYLVRQTFAQPGVYRLGANVGGGSAQATFMAVDPSTVKTPLAGRPFPVVKTPTIPEPMGVEPICTRSPACPWHDISLDAALGEKRPVVFYVGTPARCETRTCGPVLDILLSQREAYEPKLRFVHLEVYKTLTGQETIPAIAELKIESEPWIFMIGADGALRERFAGPVDRKEAAEALARLAAG